MPYKTARFEKRFASPGKHPNGLQAAADGLWSIDQADNKIYRQDFATGKVLFEAQTDTVSSSGITLGGGVFGQAGPLAKDCYSRQLNAVEAAYLLANASTVDDVRQQANLFYVCLRAKGYAIPENPETDPKTHDVMETVEYNDQLECWKVAGVGR